ncbi:MAG: site-specific integrase [Synergistaceae bacterium]|nr:site-specific integrase [Synergistaceae bacterium]
MLGFYIYVIMHPVARFFSKKERCILEVEPIRDLKKIAVIKKILRAGNTRDELLFIVGINTALRISDLLSLSIGDVVDERGKIVEAIGMREKKTGKMKKFPLNRSIKDALGGYLKEREGADHSEPLFPSRKGGALSRWQARRILSTAGDAVGVTRIGTHSLRKTFGYHVYRKTGGNLGLVQKLLNHSSSADTLRYIGIDREQMDNTYLDLNL